MSSRDIRVLDEDPLELQRFMRNQGKDGSLSLFRGLHDLIFSGSPEAEEEKGGESALKAASEHLQRAFKGVMLKFVGLIKAGKHDYFDNVKGQGPES